MLWSILDLMQVRKHAASSSGNQHQGSNIKQLRNGSKKSASDEEGAGGEVKAQVGFDLFKAGKTWDTSVARAEEGADHKALL